MMGEKANKMAPARLKAVLYLRVETQLYIPPAKLESTIEVQPKTPPIPVGNLSTRKVFPKKQAAFYLMFLVVALIGFAAYKFFIWRADKLEDQNEISAIAAKKADVESKKSAEQAQLDDYLFVHRYSNAAHGSGASRSFEESQIDKYGSRLSCQYRISYNNPICLSIGRSVFVYDGTQISTDMSDYYDLHDGSYVYKDYYEDKANGRTDMAVNHLTKSGRLLNILKLQERVTEYESYKTHEEIATEFKVLRRDSDAITNWISKYQKWCQTAQSEHLADDITNKISSCCVNTHEHGDQVDIEIKDVEFVTPNILRIGNGVWSGNEVARLEKLLSMIPSLDADLKANTAASMTKQSNEENEKASQNQLRLNEENRAKALLK